MLKTAICDLFGIRYPIIQGGMTHLATAELVSAVSGNGGKNKSRTAEKALSVAEEGLNVRNH